MPLEVPTKTLVQLIDTPLPAREHRLATSRQAPTGGLCQLVMAIIDTTERPKPKKEDFLANHRHPPSTYPS